MPLIGLSQLEFLLRRFLIIKENNLKRFVLLVALK